MNSFTIDIGNKVKLIVEQNTEPYRNYVYYNTKYLKKKEW